MMERSFEVEEELLGKARRFVGFIIAVVNAVLQVFVLMQEPNLHYIGGGADLFRGEILLLGWFPFGLFGFLIGWSGTFLVQRILAKGPEPRPEGVGRIKFFGLLFLALTAFSAYLPCSHISQNRLLEEVDSRAISPERLRQLYEAHRKLSAVAVFAANNPRCPPDVLREIAKTADQSTMRLVRRNPNAPPELRGKAR